METSLSKLGMCRPEVGRSGRILSVVRTRQECHRRERTLTITLCMSLQTPFAFGWAEEAGAALITHSVGTSGEEKNSETTRSN